MASRAEWLERVASWRASGVTASEFATGRGFSAGTLRFWASQLRKTEVSASPVASVRIARVARVRSSESTLSIEVGRARVTVGAGFDRDTLRAVLDVLRAVDGES